MLEKKLAAGPKRPGKRKVNRFTSFSLLRSLAPTIDLSLPLTLVSPSHPASLSLPLLRPVLFSFALLITPPR